MYTEAIFSRNILIDFNIIIKYHFMVLVQEKIIRVKMTYLFIRKSMWSKIWKPIVTFNFSSFRNRFALCILPTLYLLTTIKYLKWVDKFFGLKWKYKKIWFLLSWKILAQSVTKKSPMWSKGQDGCVQAG